MPKPEKLNGATAVVDEPTPQTAEQMAETEQALAPATKAPLPMGVMPKTAEEAWRLAKMIALSDLVPKGYRGRAADILVAMQYGAEVNLPPMQALHSIYVTNGRPQLWGDGLLAVIMASPKYKDHDEYFLVGGKRQDFLVEGDLQTSTTMAVTTFWRADSPRPRTATFSVAQAKRAGLLSKQGPWQEYPDRMFKMRARSWAAHDAFPDVLRGIASREEVRDGALVET
ncbi:MAG TPA: recombinase RecT, partial [Steroidobacteraceae bacterium]|nr:recombinase RecT [Steroidobacteraceae bacterium]